jgi:lysophospholipase L1-like esterase
MFRRQTWAALLAVVLSLAAVPAAHAAGRSHARHYYVALGDSLSVGYQPIGPSFAGIETRQGYVNDLYRRYAKQVSRLKLAAFGCPGESTGSLLTGKGNEAAATLYHCDRRGGSQLKAAVLFLKRHHRKGEVPLITIDIGANDVDGCASVPSSQIVNCVTAGIKAISRNTPKILRALRRAAPKGTRFVAMNLYDPILAYELSPDASQRALGSLSLTMVQAVNSTIANADKQGGFKTANVAKAFATYNTKAETFDGQQVPTGVVNICKLTWMCAPPPQGPNVHANKAGYGVIARAFEKVVGKLG